MLLVYKRHKKLACYNMLKKKEEFFHFVSNIDLQIFVLPGAAPATPGIPGLRVRFDLYHLIVSCFSALDWFSLRPFGFLVS